MVLVRVHAAIRQQAEQMQPPIADARLLHGIEQHRVGEELAILDHEIDLGDVHVDDAAGAHVEMADFAVAHLPGRQSDEASAGVDQRVGKFGQQLVVVRLARQRDGVSVGRRSVAPAIEDDEDERFRSHEQLATDVLNYKCSA